MISPRTRLVLDLIEMRRPVQDVLRELRAYPWDSEALVAITRDHVASTLKKYLSGELSSADVETWANAIEARDDVDVEKDDGALVESIVWELANPTLSALLSPPRATALLARLAG